MLRNIFKFISTVIVVLLLFLTISNFIPKAEASRAAIWGTIYVLYGDVPDEYEPYHIILNWYCLGDHSNCVIDP